MTDVIYLAPLCQGYERMWCEHDAPIDCECIDGPHPWIKYVVAPEQPTQSDALREALEDLLHAVCGEKGFAECVRRDSGRIYPWPALDLAEAKAIAALERSK